MKAVRAFLRLVFLLGLSLLLPAMAVSMLESWAAIRASKEGYEHTRAQLETTSQRVEQVEQRLVLLTTSVDAVESEVRRQLRMIRPGEELYLIEYEGTPPAVAP